LIVVAIFLRLRSSGGTSGAEAGVTIKQEETMAGPAEAILNQPAAVAGAPAPAMAGYHHSVPPHHLQAHSIVDYSPSEIVSRRSAAWPGLLVETVQVMQHQPFEYGFRAPCHLLIAAELGERLDGESFVEGLPRSSLRDFTRKLTFVPAGHVFRGSQRPRVRPISTSIRAALSPTRRCGSAR
jgi:AraC family transcriptional regulator